MAAVRTWHQAAAVPSDPGGAVRQAGYPDVFERRAMASIVVFIRGPTALTRRTYVPARQTPLRE